jgi:hypothetical protein
MYKFSLSVRAYYTGRKYGLPCVGKWSEYSDSELAHFCENAGIMAIVRGHGLKVSVELLRASGMGAYAIFESLYFSSKWADKITLKNIRELCSYFDKKLHDNLN